MLPSPGLALSDSSGLREMPYREQAFLLPPGMTHLGSERGLGALGVVPVLGEMGSLPVLASETFCWGAGASCAK